MAHNNATLISESSPKKYFSQPRIVSMIYLFFICTCCIKVFIIITCLGQLSSDGRGVLFTTEIIMLVRHELACLKCETQDELNLCDFLFGLAVCLV